MKLLENLYYLGLKADRFFRRSARLSGAHVMSVGNISSGGRAKTPMVIHVAKGLQERGYHPVVLTRGYGRNNAAALELLPESLDQIDSDLQGDEALEVCLQAKVPVLVGANRYHNASRYLEKNNHKKTVFILDDGFQHWSLQRDFDLVLVHESDFQDRLLPIGKLREPVSALKRASLVLQLNKDFFKKQKFFLPVTSEKILVLRTRATDLKDKSSPINEVEKLFLTQYPKALFLNLADHASKASVHHEIVKYAGFKIVVGGKEAVKFFDKAKSLHDFFSNGKATVDVVGKQVELVLVDLKLDFVNENLLWSSLERVLNKNFHDSAQVL
jgi:tetraacyldisaccharide-1-P 4'-kinase